MQGCRWGQCEGAQGRAGTGRGTQCRSPHHRHPSGARGAATTRAIFPLPTLPFRPGSRRLGTARTCVFCCGRQCGGAGLTYVRGHKGEREPSRALGVGFRATGTRTAYTEWLRLGVPASTLAPPPPPSWLTRNGYSRDVPVVADATAGVRAGPSVPTLSGGGGGGGGAAREGGLGQACRVCVGGHARGGAPFAACHTSATMAKFRALSPAKQRLHLEAHPKQVGRVDRVALVDGALLATVPHWPTAT